MKLILAAHCYLTANNKAEKTSDEDIDGDYVKNKGGDGGRQSAGRGRSAGVGDMRRAALVIGCSDLDLRARIAYDRSYGGGVRICRGWQ